MSYKTELNNVLASSRQARQEAEEFLVMNGETVDLSEWLTAKEYADKYDLGSTNVVTNWIRRGVIPAKNVKTVKRLNGLRLIKAVAYRELVKDSVTLNDNQTEEEQEELFEILKETEIQISEIDILQEIYDNHMERMNG